MYIRKNLTIPFEIEFVDKTIRNWYIKEERFKVILSFFVLSFRILSLGISNGHFLSKTEAKKSIRK